MNACRQQKEKCPEKIGIFTKEKLKSNKDCFIINTKRDVSAAALSRRESLGSTWFREIRDCTDKDTGRWPGEDTHVHL